MGWKPPVIAMIDLNNQDGVRAHTFGIFLTVKEPITMSSRFFSPVTSTLQLWACSSVILCCIVPCVTSSSVYRYNKWKSATKDKCHPLYCVEGAYNTATTKFLADQKLQYMTYSINFGPTEEGLYNKVFSPSMGKLEPLQLYAVCVNTEQIIDQQIKPIHLSKAYIAYNIAKYDTEFHDADKPQAKPVSFKPMLASMQSMSVMAWYSSLENSKNMTG